MVYAKDSSFKAVSFFRRLKTKVGKLLAQFFPYNRIRIYGIKLCGFKVGKDVYIGQDLIVASIISENSCNLIIGDRVAIGPRVTILLSSDANWSNLMNKIEPIKGEVVLENDCWIGAGAIIMPNVTIGNSAIVGSGAVVTKNVDPLTVVVGVPARMHKKIE